MNHDSNSRFGSELYAYTKKHHLVQTESLEGSQQVVSVIFALLQVGVLVVGVGVRGMRRAPASVNALHYSGRLYLVAV